MTKQYRWWEYAIRAMAIVAVTVWYGTLFLLRRMLGAAPTLTYRIFPRWARAVLRAAGVELQVKGSELLDREGGRYVFVANHASLFDIPVLLVASPLPVRIVYKRELERVPFLGWALRSSTFLAVERQRWQSAGKAVRHALDTLKTDPAALLVFPEGTRSTDGRLGEFRRGAFVLAFESKRAIVPIAVVGTAAILPRGTLRFSGGTVRVEFLPPRVPPPMETRADERAWIAALREEIADVVGKAFE
ncbi:MAG: 1-acyl-sn-glycerol-3-phosphate acyltransferase [Candidatus Kapaibacterium sp.]|nr:MAG: 1-acyl-sn-glycerol-3-phosphate acyltransferase [Candidatus Kapabacteria bacterium]